MTATKFGARPMETPASYEGDPEASEPLLALREAINTLPFFQRYGVIRRALLPVIEEKTAELARVDFDGQIRARVAYINRHIDKLYYACREDVVMHILPRLTTSTERIQQVINRSSLMETPMGRRLAMIMGTALLVELISALPDTGRDGNQRLMGDVGEALSAEWRE